MPKAGRFIPFRKSHAVLSFAAGAGIGALGLVVSTLGYANKFPLIAFVVVMPVMGLFTFAMYLGRNVDRRVTEEEDFIEGPRLHDRIAQELDRDMSDLAGRVPGTFYGDFGRRNE